MITITFTSRAGDCTGFTASGHAGYAPAGQDIVCAAVSALTQGTIAAIGGLTACEGETVQNILDEFHYRIRSPDHTAQILLAGLEIALQEIQNQYGDYLEVCRG